jgi:membrane associated rhomboid family serine protease
MIPLRDDAPRGSTPLVTYFLIAVNIAVFVFEKMLDSRAFTALNYQFGVVPYFAESALRGANGVPLEAAIVPMFTSMFLHASTLHLVANMWALWIFGDNIEGYLGQFRYLLLYLLSGISAAILHILFNQGSQIPTVGASGAIAGVMGAYFLLFPSSRVLTVVPFIFMFIWLPAWVVLGYWFLAQFLSGAASSISRAGAQVGGVAFWAHVGGFIAGITLIKLFPARSPRYMYGK